MEQSTHNALKNEDIQEHNNLFAMGYICFYRLSGSYQYRRNVDSFNHWLFYHPVCYPAVYLYRLPMFHGTCIHSIAFAFDYLITQYKLLHYGKFKQERVSITQTPGEEKYLQCCLGAFRGQIFYQYDYRHFNGNLFSTLAKSLEECRRRRDEWLKTQK